MQTVLVCDPRPESAEALVQHIISKALQAWGSLDFITGTIPELLDGFFASLDRWA